MSLPFVTFAYNSSRHDTASYSPFYLLFGYDPPLPIDTMFYTHRAASTAYARDALARADISRKGALDRLSASQVNQKCLYDR